MFHYETLTFSTLARVVSGVIRRQISIQEFYSDISKTSEFSEDLLHKKQQDISVFFEKLFENMKDSGDLKQIEHFALKGPNVNTICECSPSVKKVENRHKNNVLFICPLTSLKPELQNMIDEHTSYTADCPKCQQNAIRTLMYDSYPKYLFLKMSKLDWVLRIAEKSVNIWNRNYTVIGAAVHSGDQRSGHYIALVKLQGEWWRCSDEHCVRQAEYPEKMEDITLLVLQMETEGSASV